MGVAAGFECDNYSALNVHHDGPGSLPAARGKSGSSGAGVLNFIKLKRPLFFLLENTIGISRVPNSKTDKQSDLDYLVDFCNSAGYFVDHHVLNPVDFSIPASRQRIYILGMKVSNAAIQQKHASFCVPPCYQKVHEATGVGLESVVSCGPPVSDEAGLCKFCGRGGGGMGHREWVFQKLQTGLDPSVFGCVRN